MLDILNIQPTVISRDLRGKYVCLYGAPKVGKTTFAAQCEGVLLLAAEKGYNAIAGIHAADITKWSDFKVAIRQLEREEVKAKYKTIAIDTIGILWKLCEDFICSQNGVTDLSEIPWGKGYKLCSTEFERALRQITMLGYGLIIIAHSKARVEKIDDDHSIESVQPDIPDRAKSVVNQLVDIIGYIKQEFNEDGTSKRTLITRSTPFILAGSRFPHLPPVIPFGYKELVNSLADAIEASGTQDGAKIVDIDTSMREIVSVRPFALIVEEAKELWQKATAIDEENANKILNIVEQIFGERKRLSEITENQSDLYELLIQEMKALT